MIGFATSPAIEAPAAVLEPATPEEHPLGLKPTTPQEPALALESSDVNGPLPDVEPEGSMQQFVNDCCVVGAEQSCTASELYITYAKWCDENQHLPQLQRNFGVGLSSFGFNRQRRSQGRHWWVGIGLKTRDEGQVQPLLEAA